MQEIFDGDEFCPTCRSRVQEELVPDRGLCWRLSCNQCSYEKFKTCCPKCQRTFKIKNSLYAVDGLPVHCPFTDCKTLFQIVKCPVPTCEKFNFFLGGNYHMGQTIKCKTCTTQFQQVVCPHCFVNNYWKGDEESFYKMGQMIKCYSCTETFKHLACPNCKEMKYFPKSDYSYGSNQTCKRCNFNFQQVLCQSCSHSNIYLNNEFKFGKNMKCKNELCAQEFKLVACTTCGKADFSAKESKEKTGFVTKKECRYCNAKYITLLCNSNSCGSTFAISEDILITGVNNFSCTCCKGKEQKYYRCSECKEISVDSDSCKKCPPKIALPVLPEKKDPDVKLCCICLDRPAEVAFVPCGHKKTCGECSNRVMKERKPCPCCMQKIDKAIKIFE